MNPCLLILLITYLAFFIYRYLLHKQSKEHNVQIDVLETQNLVLKKLIAGLESELDLEEEFQLGCDLEDYRDGKRKPDTKKFSNLICFPLTTELKRTAQLMLFDYGYFWPEYGQTVIYSPCHILIALDTGELKWITDAAPYSSFQTILIP
jgi:hypothetical protein